MTSRELSLQIINALRAKGHSAYLAGGCVRDMLLGIEAKDYDVATDALPEQIVTCFPDALPVGAHFGVVLVRKEESQIEVATFRTDHDYRDGRHPEGVSFTRSAEQDVQRRDFTVNGLLYDPAADRYLDYVGGRVDLEARLIRAIGDPSKRFAEDKLRMLRAVRFASRLRFSIEQRTLKAIIGQAAEITEISAERIRDELSGILTEGAARRGFELLDASGLLEVVLPEVSAMKGVEQPPEFHAEGDVWTHTLLMLEQMQDPTITLALGMLLHDVGKPGTYRVAERIRFDGHVDEGVRMAEEICTRLRYSRNDTDQVMALVGQHMRFKDTSVMRASKLKRFLRMPRFEEHVELHRLDCLSSHGSLGAYEFVCDKLVELPQEVLRPPRLLTGDDLIAAGYEPGPAFQTILSDVEDAQLEGRLTDGAVALAYIRETYACPNGEPMGGPRSSERRCPVTRRS